MTGAGTAIARVIVAGALAAGAVFSVRDVVAMERETPAGVRVLAWTASEGDRLRRAVPALEPMVASVRAHTPHDAVIWCWTRAKATSEQMGAIRIFLMGSLAPRLPLPLLSSAYAASWEPRIASIGAPTFFLDIHPAFLREVDASPDTTALAASFATWPLVVEHADFTLRRRGP